MTLAIPNNLVRAHIDHDGDIATFVKRSSKWQHVWVWDNLNGQLAFSQFRRGKHVVKVNHWHSPNMMASIVDAQRMLRKDKAEPQWFGRDAVRCLSRAFLPGAMAF